MIRKLKAKISIIFFLALLSLSVIFFRPINYFYYNFFEGGCSKIEELCITMSKGWYTDYYGSISNVLVKDNRDVLMLSFLNGITVEKKIQITRISESVFLDVNLKNKVRQVKQHTIGELLILHGDLFTSDLDSVRILIPKYRLFVVVDEISTLDDFVSIE
ncbi:MAG: hypothetical protein COA54_11500 [Thiotrichaceae bacterium]|nr:MAG: hypothetical protein COA54_11500 [Thiotrichaceae bacterium]